MRNLRRRVKRIIPYISSQAGLAFTMTRRVFATSGRASEWSELLNVYIAPCILTHYPVVRHPNYMSPFMV
ncbi:uncharacterized protein H6S33_005596 [Morchella sextelata]|uniref:uncharacterized protein n=1 Tax=Morchella sextelata TaxID=1174677 RepID=UPI001D03E455|nr:uncharacterized protein H6S33_005596 [Morchella sextelata]KAH0613710.1 hypothetical protein H6S33_005596 [Morchella sextelata]